MAIRLSDNNLNLVLFLENVGEFVGLDGENLGPFQKGDLSNIPKKIADILISDEKVELVDED